MYFAAERNDVLRRHEIWYYMLFVTQNTPHTNLYVELSLAERKPP